MNPLQQGNIDPDLLDALANTDVPGYVSDRFSEALDRLLKLGVDISKLESALMTILLESQEKHEEIERFSH